MATTITPTTSISSEPRIASRASAAFVLASAIPFLMAGTIVVLRAGFPTPLAATAKAVGLSLLMVNVGRLASRKSSLLTASLVAIGALIALVLWGWSPLGGNSSVAWLFAAFGCGLFLWNAVEVSARLGVLRTVGLLVLGLTIGLYAQGMYWGSDSEHNPLYPEGIVAGRVRADVLFETAVTQMISTYHTGSTGLDGVLPLKYHTGSFWIAEGIRRICGFAPVEFGAFGYGILLIPMYVGAFFGCAEILQRAIHRRSPEHPLLFWLVATVALVGLVPYPANLLRANYNVMTFSSDSCLLGLALALLLIGAAGNLYISIASPGSRLTTSKRIAVALLLPGLLALTGFVKISVMYMCVALLVWLWWRIPWCRTWPFASAAALSVLLMGLMLRAETGSLKAIFAPLSFDRVHPEWVPYFFLLHFAWAWIFLVVWVRHHGFHTVGEVAEAARERLTILPELVLVSVAAGLIPYLVLYFNNPAWVYFTGFHAILAGALVAAFQTDFRAREFLRQLRDGTLPVSGVFILLLSLVLAGNVLMTTGGSLYRILKGNGEIRAVLAGSPDTQWRSQLKQIRERRANVSAVFAPRLQILDCLQAIRHQPPEERRTTALYIPKTNRAFWGMRQLDAGAVPFIAPAFAGVAMVDGLPEYEDVGYAEIGYGYPQYQLPTAPKTPSDDLAFATDKARRDGSKKLLVLREPSSKSCGLEQIPLD